MAENQKNKNEGVVPTSLGYRNQWKKFRHRQRLGLTFFGANLPRRKLPFFKVAPISTKLGSGGVLGTRNPNPLLVFHWFENNGVSLQFWKIAVRGPYLTPRGQNFGKQTAGACSTPSTRSWARNLPKCTQFWEIGNFRCGRSFLTSYKLSVKSLKTRLQFRILCPKLPLC